MSLAEKEPPPPTIGIECPCCGQDIRCELGAIKIGYAVSCPFCATNFHCMGRELRQAMNEADRMRAEVDLDKDLVF